MIPSLPDKPLLRALAGNCVSPLPTWLMRQAGRYLPEYRALRAKAGDFLTLCYTPAHATEVTLQPIRRFGFDAAIIFSDILVIPHALGRRLWFAEGEGPRLDPLAIADIAKLDPAAIHGHLAPVYETVSSVRAALPGNTTLIGFAGAPWTVASYMIAGGSSDETMPLRRFAYTHPAELAALIDILVEATTAYLIRQVEAGAEVLQIFESWAGTIPADHVQSVSTRPIQRIIAGIRAAKPGIPIIVFPRGAGAAYADYGRETGATAISVDTHTSLSRLRGQLAPNAVLQGNLDPQALIAGGDALVRAVERIEAQASGSPHIFNLGHGISPETPVANVEKLMHLLRERK